MGILIHKQAKRRTIMHTTVCTSLAKLGLVQLFSCGSYELLKLRNLYESSESAL